MKTKKFIRVTLVLVMVLSMLGQTVFAAEWYLDDGSITVVADDSGQKVYQGSGSDGVADDAPVITQKDSDVATTNTITLKSDDNKTVSVTIKDLNMAGLDEEIGDMDTEQEDLLDYSLIDVVGDSKAEVTVKGENLIYAVGNGDNAIIHVGEGHLTIKGDGLLDMEVDSAGAKIGSHENEDMSGTIHITDDVTILTYDNGSNDGAAIGSGQYGDFTGRIQIDGNADVSAYSNDRGAGIGVGEGDSDTGTGDFRGTVVIGGNARVDAEGDDDSTGIGNGENGYFSGGQIIIEGNAYVEAEGSDEGPAIGAAEDEPMNGTIIIRDNAEVWLDPGDDSLAHIGSEGYDAGNGVIRIEDRAKVYSDNGNPLRIGGEYDADEEKASNGLSVYIGKNVLLDGASGADVLAGNSEIQVSAAVVQETVPAPEATEVDLVCLYVLDENGKQISFKKEIVDGTMIITVEQKHASLCGALNNMLLLEQVGVTQIRFCTAEAVSVLVLDELAAAGAGSAKLVLTHTGAKAELTLAGKVCNELIR